jgi:hypothetical protein
LFSLFNMPLAFAFSRRKTSRLGIAGKVGQENCLSLWADEDCPFPAPVRGFMIRWPILPNVGGTIYLSGPYLTYFAGACAGEPLKTHHVGHYGGQMRQRDVNKLVGNRQDGG